MEKELIIQIRADLSATVKSFAELDRRIERLKANLAKIPQENAASFSKFADAIKSDFGGNLQRANEEVKSLRAQMEQTIKNSQRDLQKFNETFNQFNNAVKNSKKPLDDAANSTRNYAEGSLLDLQKQIKALKTQQSVLNVETEEYAKLQDQIIDLESKRKAALNQGKQTNNRFTESVEQINTTLKAVFGFKSIRAGISTLRGSLESIIDKFKDSNDAVKAISGDYDALKRTVEGVALSFIEANQEGLQKFLQTLTAIIPVLRDNAGTILRVVGALAIYIKQQEIANGIQTVSAFVTKGFRAALGLLSLNMQSATKATQGFSAALRANPIGFIVTAVGLLVTGFIELYNRSETFRNIVDSLTKSFTDFLTNNQTVQRVLESLKNAFVTVFNIVGGAVTVIAGIIAGFVEFAIQSGLLEAALRFALLPLQTFATLVKLTYDALVTAGQAIGDFVNQNSLLSGIVDSVSSAFGVLVDTVSNIPALFAGIRAATADLISTFADFGISVLEFFVQPIVDAFSLLGAVESDGGRALDGLRALKNQAIGEAQGIGNAFSNAYAQSVQEQARAEAEAKRIADETAARQKKEFDAIASQIKRYKSVSAEQRQILRDRVKNSKELTDSQRRDLEALINKLPELDEKAKGIFESLQDQKGKLEKALRDQIAASKDTTKTLVELEKVTKRLSDIEKEFAESTRFLETETERLNREQSDLKKTIEENIATNKPYQDELDRLILVTQKMADNSTKLAGVQAALDEATRKYANGSLADYDNKLSKLQENQKNLTIGSEGYLQVQQQIAALESERATLLELLQQDTAALANTTNENISNLGIVEAQNRAYDSARAQLAAIPANAKNAAEETKRIQEELATELERIDLNSLRTQLANVDSRIAGLDAAKAEEMRKYGNSEATRAAIDLKYSALKSELLLESANLNKEVLEQEVSDAQEAADKKTEISQEELDRRKKALDQAIDLTSAATSSTFQIINNLNAQAAQQQLDRLQQQEDAAIKEAERTGATEEQKTRIKEEFEKKRTEIEKKESAQRKALAIAEAVAQTALNVIKALGLPPIPGANIAAAAIAGALGALQIAVIASQKFAKGGLMFDEVAQQFFKHGGHSIKVPNPTKKFAKGAYLSNGRSHAQGGMPIINPATGAKVAEIEGDEAIINKRSSSIFYNLLSAINSHNNYGVSFPNANNTLGRKQLSELTSKGSSQIQRKFANGGMYAGFGYFARKFANGGVSNTQIQQTIAQTSDNTPLVQALSVLVNQNQTLINSINAGFAGMTTTKQDLQSVARMQADINRAST